jgi:uncharacterized protein (TIGR04255 family)
MVYDRAPIIEAVIDIQVKLSSLPAIAVFESIASALQPSFPVHVDANQVSINLTVDAAGQPTTSAQHLGTGKRLTNAANDRVLLVQPRGMSLSHLAPYSEWKKFRAEGVAAWREYVETVRPIAVTRLALRYINRIYVPEQTLQLEDYFNLYPATPSDFLQPIAQLFMQIQVPQQDMGPGVVAVVNLASAGKREDGANGFMLDIDLAAAQEMTVDGEHVFSRLDELRMRKNELFETFITDKTRELFK